MEQGVTLVLGPPGTGKTTTLLGMVEEEMAAGTAPERIGFVTFTRAAAQEAVGRATARFGLARDRMPYFRTLHSLCFRTLGVGRGDVLDGVRLRRDFATYAGMEVAGRWSEEGTFAGYAPGDRALFMENLARVRGVGLRAQYEADPDDQDWPDVEYAARALARFKAAEGVLDYTDMLSRFLEEGHAVGLELLWVDEAQDLSALQWRVVARLAAGCRRVVVAGDDDQAIYRWAGADVEHLLSMPGEVRVLGHSWRCPRAVQALAAGVLAGVAHRRPKEWTPRDAEGTVTREPDFRDADTEGEWGDDGVQPVLVLARNDYVLTQHVEPWLRAAGVVYERAGRPSVAAEVMAAIVAWEDLRAGRALPVEDALRAYALMTAGRGMARGHKELPAFARGDGAPPVTLADLEARGGLRTRAVWHEALDRLPSGEMSYLLAARRRGERLSNRPRVRLSTIHAAKGGEARHVVLMTDVAPRTYQEIERFPDDERRVWYVAVTRAREALTLVAPQGQWGCPWL